MSSNHHYQTPSALQQHGCGDYQPQQTKYHQQNHNVWLYPIMHGGSTATPTQQQACDYEREQAKSRRSNDPVWLYPTMHGGSTETPSFPRSLDSRYGCVPPSPRTPPPRRTGSASRQLISPPIPHRVTAQRHYPVTAVAPCIESIGNPSLQIFRLKLPTALMARLNGIVAHSEQYAQTLPDGWRTGLYSLTKQDMALREVPGMHHRIQPIVDFLVKCIQHLYSCRKVICDKNQPHILKYSIRSGHTGGKSRTRLIQDLQPKQN